MNTVSETLKSKLLGVRTAIDKNIIGQEQMLPELIKNIERGELGLADSKRPKGSFLFLGPTGVGKTELTLTFTEYLFDEDCMYRFDMSEFRHIDSIKQFIGDETGSHGRLGRVLEHNKHGTLLFDEMEKAHPQIMDIFLQILDAARVTLGNGKTYNLSNYYIVFTSNIGAKRIPDKGTVLSTILESGIKAEVKKHLRKEMIARFGDICIFQQLDYNTQKDIAKLILGKELQRMNERGYHLTCSSSAFHYMIVNGIQEGLGVRPLRDTIQKSIGDAICDEILRGGNNPNGELIHDKDNNCLKINQKL
jgi:ATP-dependent Clp protease ATP-binding subunit ClpA